MAEISLRTNDGVYDPGDTLYGMIYLNVHQPIAGQCVSLSFKGYEKYKVRAPVIVDGIVKKYVQKSGKRMLLDCSDVTVYETNDGCPIPFGCYMFPFKFKLNLDLPGSCSYTSGSSNRVVVQYCVIAQVVGCGRVKAKQEFFINQRTEVAPTLSSSQTFGVRSWTNFFKKQFVTLRTSILKGNFSTDDHILLDIGSEEIECLSNRPSDHEISIQVLHDVKVILPRWRSKSIINLESSALSDEDDDEIVDEKNLAEFVDVVKEMPVWSETLRSIDIDILKSCRIRIPIDQFNGSVVCPSTNGKHILSDYKLRTEFRLSDENPIVVILPIPSIHWSRDANTQWANWTKKVEDWFYGCQMVKGDQAVRPTKAKRVCAVPEDELGTAFTGYPGLQPN
ncbi:uncharacterized protein LOC141903806 isoform X2 [Tubulanus polymorphus]|uniref:uncharacterized protein LOC141903806 isoform X2 n=1 Tax=Tubulanus polymorphus TaxID=672921 RepID=UPI003DA6B280